VNAGTPGRADEAAELERESAARKLEFDNWFGSQGYDDEGRFDSDEMEFAFEAGREAAAAREPKPAPELAAATAETRAVRNLLDDFTHAVIDLDARAGKLTAAAKAVRKKAGLPPVEGK
jgi:hypothetical protein